MPTKLYEQRSETRVDGVSGYRVSVGCTDRGDLPDTGLFLYQIVDQASPLTDVFVRIVEVADLSTTDGYLANRLNATIAGAEYWRSSSLAKEYTDLETAKAGTQAIFDRVNALVNEYADYIANFKTTGEEIEFPTADPSYVDSLKTAYNDAYTAYTTSLTALATAQTDLDTANADLATQQTELDHWLEMSLHFSSETDNDQLRMSEAHSDFNNFVSGGTGNAAQFVAAVDAVLFTYQGKFGPETRKVSMANSGTYTPAVASDVGKAVVQATTGDSGTLVTFNNSTREWWVTPDDSTDVFTTSDQVTVTTGTGKGNPSGSFLVGAGPMDPEIESLRASRNAFDSARQSAAANVAKADLGVDHHDTTTAPFIGDQVTAHTAAVSTAQTAVVTAQTAYNQAQGNVQTAYTALGSAYDAVKAVCPNWSPTNPFPPVPA